MSLLTRILLLILFTTLTPGLVIGVYLVNQRELAIENAKHDLGALAKYAVENIDDKVKGTVQLLHGLSRATDLDTSNKATCSTFLAGVLERYPQYTGVLTITPEGALHCDSLRSGRILDLSRRDYFTKVRATREPAFDMVIGGITGIAVLQVAYPVLDHEGSLKYVLLASLNLSQYAKGFTAASQFPTLRMLVWNRMGILMASQPDTGASLAGKDLAGSELFRFAASAGAHGAELPDMDGVTRVWTFSSLSEQHGSGARIALGIPRDDLVARANRSLRNALILLIGVSLLAFAGAWYIADVVIRRHVRRIASVAGRVGSGDLAARIGGPYPRGELGELMGVLDRTASAVQAQQAEIELKSRDIQRVNRTLRMLSGINTLIVRVHDRDELFKEACRIAVEEGGFRVAWIGLVDRGASTIAVTSAGGDEALITLIKNRFPSNAGVPLENSMAARAIRERNAIVSNDLESDHKVLFRADYIKSGVRSMALLPLIVADHAVGVLALHASEVEFFNEEELKLLTEIACDIAFAIDHIEKRERLDYLAYYDPLTGLANHSLFLERVAQYMRSAAGSGHKLAVYLVDLERFKNINDSLGRPAGDALLKAVAEWLTRHMGNAHLLARIGADHFAMVCPGVKNEEDAARLLEKMLAVLLEHSFQLADSAFRIAAKVGVALYPDDGADADTLFRHAEAALKKAKSSGERYLFYTQKMTDTVAGKLTLENQLRQALDNEEFVLHYQPKVNLASGKVVSAEALIRWNDPRTGLVPPGQFIPILEETGLIYDVGRWAMRKALQDSLRWRAAGLPAMRIAVNVSPLQVRNRGFISEIEQVIGIDAHAASGLELEITESLIMEDVKHNIASLQAIRAMGVTIAIDDFGTGFSSLSYLSKLPADTLKIDRSFVNDMALSPEGLALVSTIINLAHSLKLKVVAEGVETEEQSRLLRLLGCDEMQGFLFSKPVPSEIFEAKYLAPPAAVAADRIESSMTTA